MKGMNMKVLKYNWIKINKQKTLLATSLFFVDNLDGVRFWVELSQMLKFKSIVLIIKKFKDITELAS